MADQFDPYREKLVLETATVWPEEFDDWEPAARERLAARLHAGADQAAQLEYVRLHSGFRRQITVTQDDLERLK